VIGTAPLAYALHVALVLATPTALWGLAGVVPIVVFHLYFRRRRRVLVPFAPLLAESLGPVKRQARFKRLREAASLLARLGALLCVVLALGGLRPAEARAPEPDLVLVIDADVTTAAREQDGARRLEHARRLARAWIHAMPATDEGPLAATVSVVVAGQAPRLLVPPTTDRDLALRRLDLPLVPAPAEADLAEAFDLALAAVDGRDPARVVVLSARSFEVPPTPTGVEATLAGTGRARGDQRIVEFDVSAAAAAASEGPGYDVRLAVINDAAEARTRSVVVRLDEREVAREDLEVQAGDASELRLRVPAPREAAWLTLALEGGDDFPGNDVVEARLTPVPRPSLLVVHGGRVRPYVAAAVAALAGEGLIDEKASGFVKAADLVQARPRDVMLVDGVALAPEALRPGAYLFLAPLGGALPFDLGVEVHEPLVWRTRPGHPLVEGLDFRRAFVARGRAVGGRGLEALAYAEGRPILAEGERDGVRYVVLGLDPEGSMLPTQGALPLLVRNAVLRLARAPTAPLKPRYRRGEALRSEVDLPGGPQAELRWEGVRKDDVLAAAGRGRARGRLAPDGAVWHVPAGAVGRTRITTGTDTKTAWSGWTVLGDLDPARTIVPVRPPAVAPAAAAVRHDRATRWRRALLALAVLLLLLDLALLAHTRAASARS